KIGAIDDPGTRVLFGGDLDRDPRHGVRLTAGYWLDDCSGKAIEVSGFFLGQSSANFNANSAAFPVLSRPFIVGNPGFMDVNRVENVTLPGFSTGSIKVEAPSSLWGVEANLRCEWCCGCDYRINALAGARYLNLQEGVTITEDVQTNPLTTATP